MDYENRDYDGALLLTRSLYHIASALTATQTSLSTLVSARALLAPTATATPGSVALRLPLPVMSGSSHDPRAPSATHH